MELRWFYPIDWPQLSAWVRFDRSQGHGEIVHHLGDGRWFDEEPSQRFPDDRVVISSVKERSVWEVLLRWKVFQRRMTTTKIAIQRKSVLSVEFKARLPLVESRPFAGGHEVPSQ